MRAIKSALLALALTTPWTASAKVLEVGPNATYKQPSEAIAAAAAGDTVRIAPGQYRDCAVVKQDRLTLEASGPNVVMAEKMCAGKAILVVDGDKVTIRGLTFARAHLPEFNGAGIRAEGGDLTIEDTRFVNNENGLMSAPNPNATIRVTGSSFFGNGSCKGACAHGIYAGHIKLLHVERSVFRDTHEGHHIKSRALRTEIVNCNIQDGPAGASSYLIDVPNGGSLLIEKNKLEKGPMTQNQGAAIMIGAEGVNQPTNEIIVRNNSFTNDSRGPTVFVNNRTETVAVLTGNLFTGAVSPLSDATGPVH